MNYGHPAKMDMIPIWNKHLELYQYGPASNSERMLIKHCHPKGESWVNHGDTELKEYVALLMVLHGFEANWIQPKET